jgi:2'-5' RNA ligase
MHGVVSLLDERHCGLVEELWAELARRFGLRGIAQTPYPHFSYQVAESYELALLEPILRRFADNSGGFNIRTTGLGVFTGPKPVLYVPVVRSTALTRFQRELWPELSRVAGGVVDYYHPENWIPHITLATDDLTPQSLCAVMGWLADRSFNWEIKINNLALIQDTADGKELRFHFEW